MVSARAALGAGIGIVIVSVGIVVAAVAVRWSPAVPAHAASTPLTATALNSVDPEHSGPDRAGRGRRHRRQPHPSVAVRTRVPAADRSTERLHRRLLDRLSVSGRQRSGQGLLPPRGVLDVRTGLRRLAPMGGAPRRSRWSSGRQPPHLVAGWRVRCLVPVRAGHPRPRRPGDGGHAVRPYHRGRAERVGPLGDVDVPRLSPSRRPAPGAEPLRRRRRGRRHGTELEHLRGRRRLTG